MNQKEQYFQKSQKSQNRFSSIRGATCRYHRDSLTNNHYSPVPAYRFAGKSIYINVIMQGTAVEDYVSRLNFYNFRN